MNLHYSFPQCGANFDIGERCSCRARDRPGGCQGTHEEKMQNSMPTDIKAQATAIAKNYYILLAHCEHQEKSTLPCEHEKQKIRAVEQAWARMGDDVAREFVRRNLFEGERMQYIDLPVSISTMKRLRRRFLLYVSEELRGVRQE